MKFRRLYWVTEEVDQAGETRVTGVYTSIQDLTHKGLHWCKNSGQGGTFRLTLVKPDTFNCPLGVWESPSFNGLESGLEEFVQTNEYTRDECVLLQQELSKFIGGATPAR